MTLRDILIDKMDLIRIKVRHSSFRPKEDLADVFDIVREGQYPDLFDSPYFKEALSYIRGAAAALDMTPRELLYEELTEEELQP